RLARTAATAAARQRVRHAHDLTRIEVQPFAELLGRRPCVAAAARDVQRASAEQNGARVVRRETDQRVPVERNRRAGDRVDDVAAADRNDRRTTFGCRIAAATTTATATSTTGAA